MDERLHDLYCLPPRILPQDIYLLDLSQQCTDMEARVRDILEKLSTEDRQIVEAYLDLRNELEFQSTKAGMQFGKHLK